MKRRGGEKPGRGVSRIPSESNRQGGREPGPEGVEVKVPSIQSPVSPYSSADIKNSVGIKSPGRKDARTGSCGGEGACDPVARQSVQFGGYQEFRRNQIARAEGRQDRKLWR